MEKFLKKIEGQVSEVEFELLKESFDKLSDVVESKDLSILGKALDGAIEEGVKAEVDAAIEEVSAKSEELLEAKGKELVKEYLAEKVELEAKVEAHGKELVVEFQEFKDKLVEEYLEEKEELQGLVMETLDEYLVSQINENINSDLLDKIAINECLTPVVDGVMKVFAENYVELGTDVESLKESHKAEVAKLEDRLNESIQANIENEKLIEESAKVDLIAKETAGLNESQVEKVMVMFAESSFNDVKGKLSAFIDLISEEVTEESMIESEGPVEGETITESAEPVSEEDETIQELTENVELQDDESNATITEGTAKPVARAAAIANKYF